MKKFPTLYVAMLWSGILTAQISFTNHSNLLVDQNLTSGVALAVADMNADGLDDLVRLNDGYILSVEYQQPGGTPFTGYLFGDFTFDRSWAIAVGDVNNDGYADIMTGGRYDGVKIFTATNNGAAYQQANLPGPTIFVQGSNLADINNDGFLDVFNCHDDGESKITGNDGTGSFFVADDWIDMSTTPASDNSGNYGSVWTDFDNDRDLDLYIAKCRQGVSNPEDPRRINALFVNDGQQNYAEAAESHGLQIKHQSWTADFQDIDNDGDLDCFITNHDHNLQLLENDGSGHFTDISEAAGFGSYTGFFLQGFMRDFDNDGWIDIVTARPYYLFRNNGNKTFTALNNTLEDDPRTLACGDLNHDGFQDFYAAYHNDYNTPASKPDKIFLNDGNDNHFLSVSLEGNASNRMGVGARIEIFGSWGVQVREIRSGESYGINHSLSQAFGIGQDTLIPYLVVKWPSGNLDVLRDVAADQFLTITESTTCELPDFEVEVEGNLVLCPGDSAILIAPPGYTYLWNNGLTSPSLTTYQPGNFSVVMLDSNGCAAESEVVRVRYAGDETPMIEALGSTEFCGGSSVALVASNAASFIWSTGDTTASIDVSQTGDYFVSIQGACAAFTSDTLHIEVLANADVPLTEDVTIFTPQAVTLEASGQHPRWFDAPDATVPLAEGNAFTTPVLESTTTFYVDDVNKYGGGNFATGMEAVQFTLSPYNGNNFNGQVVFDVYQAFTLREVTVSTDSAGIRIIEVLDDMDQVIHSKAENIPVGETTITLDFYLEPGSNYKLTTNTAQNLAVLGTNSPRLTRSNLAFAVQYPYVVPNVVNITGSNFGAGFYYYFFNWQIEVPSLECASDKIPVTVFVQPNAVREAVSFGNLSVQPNPAAETFGLVIDPVRSGPCTMQIMSPAGKIIYSEPFEVSAGIRQIKRISLPDVPSGLYFLQVRQDERSAWVKVQIE